MRSSRIDGRPQVAPWWSVTVDPEFEHRRRTFEVPVDGLIGFIATAFARGSTNVLLYDGTEQVRVSRAGTRSR